MLGSRPAIVPAFPTGCKTKYFSFDAKYILTCREPYRNMRSVKYISTGGQYTFERPGVSKTPGLRAKAGALREGKSGYKPQVTRKEPQYCRLCRGSGIVVRGSEISGQEDKCWCPHCEAGREVAARIADVVTRTVITTRKSWG